MKIVIPTSCPSCGSLLEKVNGQLFCRSATCPAQSSKTVENFCKKMKIKGFGERTIEKLDLGTISDLYTLDLNMVAEILGERTAEKLLDEIAKSCTCDFAQFISSLGIPLIGTVAAKKLAACCNSIEAISPQICKDAGLGAKATDNLINFFNSELGLEIEDTVNMYITFIEQKQIAPINKSVEQIDICITGKLNDFPSRNKAAEYLAQYGITVKGSVTKSVQYLICEDESKRNSSSYKKALANGIEITSIQNLIKSLEK